MERSGGKQFIVEVHANVLIVGILTNVLVDAPMT